MDGWMDGSMDRWMDGGREGGMDGWMGYRTRIMNERNRSCGTGYEG